MRPQRADTMSGMADWRQWNVPVRLIARMRFHDSRVMSVKCSNTAAPALVTRISTCSELAAHPAQRLVDRPAVDDVDLAAQRLCAVRPQIPGDPLRAVAIEVEQSDPIAALREPPAHRQPDAGCGSRDHGDAAHPAPSKAHILGPSMGRPGISCKMAL